MTTIQIQRMFLMVEGASFAIAGFIHSGLLGMGSGIKVVVHEQDLERALAQARQLLAEDRRAPEKKAGREKDAQSIQRPPESIQRRSSLSASGPSRRGAVSMSVRSFAFL